MNDGSRAVRGVRSWRVRVLLGAGAVLIGAGVVALVSTRTSGQTSAPGRVLSIARSDAFPGTPYLQGGRAGQPPCAVDTQMPEYLTGVGSPLADPLSCMSAGDDPTGIACASSTRCFIVGDFGTPVGSSWSSMLEWDGRSWSLSSPPSDNSAASGSTGLAATGRAEVSIACASPTMCMALGGGRIVYGPLDPPAFAGQPLSALWNGRKWATQPLTGAMLPDGGAEFVPHALACPSARTCIAIGSYLVGNSWSIDPASETWNGRTWQFSVPGRVGDKLVTPFVQGNDDITLTSISCPAVDWCLAAGSVGPSGNVARPWAHPYVAMWNGRAWSARPIWSQSGEIDAVSCAAVSDCIAVGNVSSSASLALPLVDHLSGAADPPQVLSAQALGRGARLVGVACSRDSSCLAVGTNAGASPGPLVARVVGTSVAAEPIAYASPGGRLATVACWAPGACFAAGATGTGATLVEGASSKGWAGYRAPATTYTNGAYSGISCPAPGECVAIGYSGPPATDVGQAGPAPIAELWLDGRWRSVLTAPAPAGASISLDDVACGSATFCVALGSESRGSGSSRAGTSVIVERWDGPGSSFTVVPGPVSDGVLTSMACPSPTECLAVGTAFEESLAGPASSTSWIDPADRPLVVSITSTVWRVSEAFDRAGPGSLESISCPGKDFCMAVGQELTHQVVMTWNGQAWRVVGVPPLAALPPPQSGQDLLVSCSSARNCWIVVPLPGLLLHWDGTAWRSGPPVSGADWSQAMALTCASQTRCVIVGAVGRGTAYEATFDGLRWAVHDGTGLQPRSPWWPWRVRAVACPSTRTCFIVGEESHVGIPFGGNEDFYEVPILERLTL